MVDFLKNGTSEPNTRHSNDVGGKMSYQPLEDELTFVARSKAVHTIMSYTGGNDPVTAMNACVMSAIYEHYFS